MDRVRYPNSEEQHSWLSPLLDTYHLIDEAVKRDLEPRHDKVPCGRGCSSCCKEGIVPINSIEARGIRWYVINELLGETRKKILSQIRRFEPGQETCPFLTDKQCGIYAVRPVSCRTFHVIGNPCKPGGDITDIDDKNIYRTPKDKLRDAARPMLSAFDLHDPREQERSYNTGYLLKMARPLRDLDWGLLILPGIDVRDVWHG